jgi:di/tricarboxylate transporter
MDISTAAIASMVALAIVVIISCVNEDLNVGFLGIGFAIIVGGVFSGMTGAKVMASFPLSLFMILIGVTFLFGMAQTNGTMEKLTAYSVRVCKGNTALIPLIVYILTTFVTTIGPGNIAGCALMAPVAMAIATRVGMPAFLMTLIVVGAANGAAFSPFAPTGIISNGIIAKMAPQLGIAADSLNSLAWKIHFNSTLAQGFINIGGFFLLGGWAWIQKQRGATLDIDEIAPKPEPFNKHQWLTLGMVAVLILLVVLPGMPAFKGLFPKVVMNMLSNVGSIAFVLSCVLMLTGSGDSKAAVKVMPWGVIMMVCGVSVLIDVMDKAGGLNAMVKMIGSLSGPTTVNFWLGLIPGLISAYSSSSGVVMPMFLPMVPGLIKEIGGGDPIALISTINIGSHIVDTSPLSTLGALCIASAGDHEDKAKLFRNLLIWGLSMGVVGAVVCYVFFGILGL